MQLGDFVLPDSPYTGPPPARQRPHLSDPDFISENIRGRGEFEWTHERIEIAANLWNDGNLKREIAAHFGVSIDSVIGMIHRNRSSFSRHKSGKKNYSKRTTTQIKRG